MMNSFSNLMNPSMETIIARDVANSSQNEISYLSNICTLYNQDISTRNSLILICHSYYFTITKNPIPSLHSTSSQIISQNYSPRSNCSVSPKTVKMVLLCLLLLCFLVVITITPFQFFYFFKKKYFYSINKIWQFIQL